MANDFKRFTVSSAGTGTGASGSALYSCPAGSGSSALESIIIGITLANKTTTGVTADIYLDGYDGTDTYIVKSATIPAGSALEVMSGNKIVLQNSGSAGDVIRVTCGTASSLDATLSVLEDV